MKRLLKSLFVAIVIMLVPTIVNAKEITTGTPGMSDATLNGKPVFEAKGSQSSLMKLMVRMLLLGKVAVTP